MPTRAVRRSWWPLALQCFAEQTYQNRELVVGIEASDAPQWASRIDARVRLVITPPGLTLGAKRNFINAAAHGQLIAHWDDDDWSAPWRLATQAAALCVAGSTGAISGCRTLVFVDVQSGVPWTYTFAAVHAGVHGTTLCYQHSTWERARFPAVTIGEDYSWCRTGDFAVIEPADPFMCVATAHAHNTAPRQFSLPPWQPIDAATLPSDCKKWLAYAKTVC